MHAAPSHSVPEDPAVRAGGVSPDGTTRAARSDSVPENLRRMLADPDRVTALRLWRLLSLDDRAEVAEAFMRGQPVNRTSLVNTVAAARNFRPHTVRKWPDEKIADAMKRAPLRRAKHAADLFGALADVPKWRMMAHRFAGLLGLADPAALLDPGADVPPERVRSAAASLAEEVGRRDAAMYLLSVSLRRTPVSDSLKTWMREQAERPAPDPPAFDRTPPASETPAAPTAPEAGPTPEIPAVSPASAPAADAPAAAPRAAPSNGTPPSPAADAPAASPAAPSSGTPPTPAAPPVPQPPPEPQPQPGEDIEATGRGGALTTLDFVLLRAVEDAKDGIKGALSEDEVDDMVDDYAHLNGRRHRSHLHAGFRDALFGRELVEDWTDASRHRARWYWAGVMQGWARSESWRRIVQEYDRRSTVRRLGDGSPPSVAGVEHVVRALRAEGRASELAEFVRPRALAAPAGTKLFQSLLDAGTDLLRDGDAAGALALFQRLRQVSPGGAGGDSPDREQLVLDARRRQAHCLRHLGQSDKARRILQDLLKRDPPARVRAMAHADLGLLKGGFRELADVRLPRDRESLDKLTRQLEAGRRHFEKSAEEDVRYASHGHYCLGALDMCRGQYAQAARRLEQAYAVIGAGGHYERGLVARTTLYLGVAEVLCVSEQDSSLGTRRIVEGLERGATLPPYFVDDIMTAYESLGATSDLQLVAEWIQKTGGERAFDALAAGPAVDHCKWMAPALYGRACRPGRKKKDAVADLVLALRGYQKIGAVEDSADAAMDVLDLLEEYALQGIGAAEFMELLSRDKYDCPPLGTDDARVLHAGCLEAHEDFQAAAEVLKPLFYAACKERKLYDAEGILEQIKELGLPSAYHGQMEKRLTQLDKSLSRVLEAPREGYAARRVKVLVVGGDERQTKTQDQVLRAIGEKDAAVDVTFVRSGWSANWQQPLSAVRSSLKDSDAVVIMRFVRTHFGRRVREECGAAAVRWCYCWSGGDAGQVRAVLEAARIARSAGRGG